MRIKHLFRGFLHSCGRQVKAGQWRFATISDKIKWNYHICIIAEATIACATNVRLHAQSHDCMGFCEAVANTLKIASTKSGHQFVLKNWRYPRTRKASWSLRDAVVDPRRRQNTALSSVRKCGCLCKQNQKPRALGFCRQSAMRCLAQIGGGKNSSVPYPGDCTILVGLRCLL